MEQAETARPTPEPDAATPAPSGPGRGRTAAATFARSIAAIVLAVVVASIVLAISGFGATSLVDSLGNAATSGIADTLRWTTPLLLTGLGTVVVFRARIWNIGLDGQLYVGALGSTIVARLITQALDPNIGLVVCLLASIIGGAVFAAIPAVLRIVWGAPEIVTTVILITVGQDLVNYAVQGPLKSADPATAASLSTDPIDSRLWLVQLIPHSQATVGIFLAVGCAILVAIYLRKTRWGYEHRIYGANAGFSFYGGVSNRKVFLQAMLISGALGGLAGGIEVMGVFHNLTEGFNPSLGFTGIAVALVANNNELAVILSALFFGALQVAGNHLQLATSAPPQYVGIVTGVVILMMTGRVFGGWFDRIRVRRKPPHPASGDVAETARSAAKKTGEPA